VPTFLCEISHFFFSPVKCTSETYFTFLLYTRCTVAGWGKDAFGPSGQYQNIERSATVPVLGWSDCQAKLQATRLGLQFQFNHASFICAGGEEGYDACTVSLWITFNIITIAQMQCMHLVKI